MKNIKLRNRSNKKKKRENLRKISNKVNSKIETIKLEVAKKEMLEQIL